MRRFSQKNHLVTLNEINITPLLDLAFVLLIIFIITTPLLENHLQLSLPKGGDPPKERPRDLVVKTIEINRLGQYYYNRQHVSLEQIQQELAAVYRANTNLVVAIRSDGDARYRMPAELIHACQQIGIKRFDLNMQPER
jgi:biopolymer transport protein ExbD